MKKFYYPLKETRSELIKARDTLEIQVEKRTRELKETRRKLPPSEKLSA